MKLNKLGPNKTEVQIGNVVVFFSYNTPVAAQLSDGKYVRTNKKWSVTTSKHINQWLGGVRAEEVEQCALDFLAGE